MKRLNVLKKNAALLTLQEIESLREIIQTLRAKGEETLAKGIEAIIPHTKDLSNWGAVLNFTEDRRDINKDSYQVFLRKGTLGLITLFNQILKNSGINPSEVETEFENWFLYFRFHLSVDPIQIKKFQQVAKDLYPTAEIKLPK